MKLHVHLYLHLLSIGLVKANQSKYPPSPPTRTVYVPYYVDISSTRPLSSPPPSPAAPAPPPPCSLKIFGSDLLCKWWGYDKDIDGLEHMTKAQRVQHRHQIVAYYAYYCVIALVFVAVVVIMCMACAPLPTPITQRFYSVATAPKGPRAPDCCKHEKQTLTHHPAHHSDNHTYQYPHHHHQPHHHATALYADGSALTSMDRIAQVLKQGEAT